MAQQIGGTLIGDANRSIEGLQTLDDAGPRDLAFVVAAQIKQLAESKAGVVLAPVAAREKLTEHPDRTLILVDDPQAAFLQMLPHIQPLPARPAAAISPHAVIDPSARIGCNVFIGPFVVIEAGASIDEGASIYAGAYIGPNCAVGADCTIHPQAVLYRDVTLGRRVIIHAHAVIGADGFGYRFVAGRFEKIPQIGGVIIEDDAEIGAGTTVDCGAIGDTRIGSGTKLDNQVMIAHNCKIGRHNVFASQVGLAGSCSTGDYVRMGGQVGIRDHVHIGQRSSLGARSGVHCDIPDGETWIGFPATPEQEQKRLVFSLKRVPEMRDQMKEMTREIAMLKTQLASLIGGDESSKLAG